MLKEREVNGIIKVIVVRMIAHVPYREEPKDLVIIGICITPSTTVKICVASV
jgi:hypothetical protein